MTITAEKIHAGQAVYTKGLLAFYDLYVLWFSNRFAWKCPTPRLLDLYDRHLSRNHLEVGVGTGYFLDRCSPRAPLERLALIDLNPNCLERTARRVARFRPECYRHNIFDPIAVDGAKFDSVGINFVIHCLPGTLQEKASAFEHLKAAMNPGGVLFGSTILHAGVEKNPLGRILTWLYNRRGICCNLQDSPEGLRAVLARHFRTSSVEVVGCVGLFVCGV